MSNIRVMPAVLIIAGFAFYTMQVSGAPKAANPSTPLYGLFETEILNSVAYDNPFADVELNAVFASPTGRKIRFFGFYDGDATDGRNAGVWKQRFMPDEVGAWTYTLTFSDGQPGRRGGFQCVPEGAKPGPWRQESDNPLWFRTATGDHFLPTAMFANCVYCPTDWQDAVQWCKTKGFNTLVTRTFNHYVWGTGWKNVTCFGTANAAKREVDYDRMNLEMWREWDQMIQHAGENGIYIGSFEGPCGKYGGQWRGKYPPPQLVMNPGIRERFDTPRNLKVIRYLVARQGAFWNLAYWSLGNTEVYAYAVADEKEFLEYGEYLTSITPWERMITGQDAEQWHGENRRWMSNLNIPNARKLNTVQTAVHNPNKPSWGKSNVNDTAFQNAGPNNELALDSYGGFPVLTTEGLWEGQGRATKPLRIIWGFFAGGAHTMWADWNYEQPDEHDFGSIGRGWAPPVKPLDRHQFRIDQLGVNCVGDEQLKIATDAMNELRYWKMTPHNEIVVGSTEAYCLAEPGAQYMVYAPKGGTVKLALSDAHGSFGVKWLDPRTGNRLDRPGIQGGAVCTLNAPGAEDWVLLVAEQLTGEKKPGFVSQSGGRQVPGGVKALRDLEYAKVDGQSLRLDLFVPEDTTIKPPLLVWIHGGGWTKGSKSQFNPMFLRLTAEGYATASIDYRLEGLNSHPKQIHDCKGAIRWLRSQAEKYGYDATRIGVGGGSAGGHLVLLLGLSAGVEELEGDIGGNLDQSSQVHAIVDLYGPSALDLFAEEKARFANNKTPELLKSASPLSYLDKEDPPVIIFYGDQDKVVPPSQNEEVHKRYQETGIESSLHLIKGAGHGGPQFSDTERYSLVKAFVDRHIKQRY